SGEAFFGSWRVRSSSRAKIGSRLGLGFAPGMALMAESSSTNDCRRARSVSLISKMDLIEVLQERKIGHEFLYGHVEFPELSFQIRVGQEARQAAHHRQENAAGDIKAERVRR